MDIWKNNNTLGRYKESLPLEDRDEYARWKKDYDYKNTSEYKRNKFNSILDSRSNKDGISAAWYTFINNMIQRSRNPHISHIGKDHKIYEYISQSEIIDDNDDAFFIDMTYNREDQDNIVLLLDPCTDNNYYDKNFDSVINDIMKSKKMRITIHNRFRSKSLKGHSSDTKKYINLYAKDMIDQGYYRFQVARDVKLLTNPDKELEPYINYIKEDFGTRKVITDCYFSNNYLACDITFIIPYNFGVKSQDIHEMTNKSEKLSEYIYNIIHNIDVNMCNRKDY